MNLGAFSISLTVQDMAASMVFYQKLGFEKVGGDGESWTILANGSTVIGLFHGMFDSNILTFNPGWTGVAEPLEQFTDIRMLASRLQAAGVEVGETTAFDVPSGPASFTIVDPDGNVILLDQHV